MLNYKEKYLKYKAKYLQLKGGRITTLKNSLAVKDCVDEEKLSAPSTSTKEKCILFNNKLNTNNNTFILNLLLEINASANCDYNMDFLNWMRNLNIPSQNVYNIINNNINHGSRGTCLTVGDVKFITNYSDTENNMKDYIKLINRKVQVSDKKNTVLMHISSHGSLNGNNLFSFDGSSYGRYITVDNFLSLMQPLFDNKNITNIILVVSFCYSGLRLKNALKRKVESIGHDKNITIITVRPVITELVLLSAFLETNPNSVQDWNTFKTKKGVYNRVVEQLYNNYGITREKIDLVISEIPEELNKNMSGYIECQRKHRYSGDKYDDSVFSNNFYKFLEEGHSTYPLRIFHDILSTDNYYTKKLKDLNELFRDCIKKEMEGGLWFELNKSNTEPELFYCSDEGNILKNYIYDAVIKSNFVHNLNNNNEELNEQKLSDLF
jgi:hypothetical protein